MSSLNDYNFKILVISLPNSPRRKQVVQEFAKHSLNFEFIEAIWGNDLDLYNDKRINAKRLTEIGMIKIPGNVGAALSHIKCHQQVIEDKLDFALIFEDDILLKPGFKTLLPEILSASSRQGVTMLFYQCFSEIILNKRKSAKIKEEYSIYEYINDKTIFSAAAYIIWNETAQKIIDYLLPVCASPDAWNLFKREGVIKDIKLVFPMPCMHSLSPSEMSYPVKNKIKRLINPVTKNLKRVKIPFVQSLLKMWRNRLLKSQQNIRIVE